ncbi:MAG: hypothetical protein COU68_05260 [Candidatus Pacebacteria bacterium CG10_big_fil_rev_8_21_14_0_10_45_6]|nr:MAG: hypothetical protein COU68_05260 [Candidatus Pacebacteria bacterium CG10_big_fil_rev_8_21_14_0_10_45_6]
MIVHKYNLRRFTLFSAIAILLVRVPYAFAQIAGDGEFTKPTKSRELIDLIQSIAELIMYIALPFLAIAIIWAGYRIVAARGNDSELSAARAMLLWSIIGAIVVIAAPTLTEIITDIVTF